MRRTGGEMRGLLRMEEILQDGKYAFRQLRKAYGFTLVAICVLALGVGANTAIFSVIDAVLLKPLPYPDNDRLVWMGETLKGNSTDLVTLTPDFLDWRDRSTAFTGMAAFNVMTRTLTGAGGALQLRTAKASSTLLPVLQIQPIIGRNFSQEEDHKGSDQVALISYDLWERDFGGNRNVLGRSFSLDDRAYAVIGVLPPSFFFPASGSVDVITPLAKNEATERKRGNGISVVHEVIARLRPGVSLERARGEMEALESHLAPPSFMSTLKMTIAIVPLRTRFVGGLRSSLFALLCAVGFLLLMSCANLSNLLLSRAIARQREMAIRASFGASRGRLIKQLLIESIALAMLGCLAGLLLAYWTRGILVSLLPASVPGLDGLSFSWRVLSFTLLSALVSAVLFGVGPALLGSSAPISQGLAKEGRFAFLGVRRQRLLNALASTQVAIAIVLLCGGGLMLQSFWNLRYRDLGFRTEHLLTTELHLSGKQHADPAAQALFLRRFLDNASALPGVEAVAMGDVPPGEGHATNGFAVAGQTAQRYGHRPTARSYAVSPNYFRILQIPLLKGRAFSREGGTRSHLAIVNETFVQRNLRGQDPLGQKVRLERDDPWSTIVGVVADVKTGGLVSAPESVIYFPYSQVGAMDDEVGILVRTALSPAFIEPELRKEIARLDLQQPITGIQTMDRHLDESAAKPRLAAFLLGCFAALGLVLASVGQYGVMALFVRGKLRELGVRLALGACPYDVLRMVLMESARIVAVGITVGVCCAVFLTRLMQSLLYGVSASDPLVFGAVTVFLVVVALAAAYLPARRASRIDPMATLRID